MTRAMTIRVGLLGGGLLLLLGARPAQADPPDPQQVATSEPAACVLVPTLSDCSPPPSASWPAGELFSFVIACPPPGPNDPQRPAAGDPGSILMEQTDVLGGTCPPLRGTFRETSRVCDGKRLFEYTEPLQVGQRYQVTHGESRLMFVVVDPSRPGAGSVTNDCRVPVSDYVPPPVETPTPPPAPPPETWNDREDFAWEASAGPVLMLLGSKRDTRLLAGGTLSIGFRSLRPYESGDGSGDGKISWPKAAPGTIWCAPVFCGIIGMLFMPESAIVGTELGGDLRISVLRQLTGDPDGIVIGAGVRPVLRVAAPDSKWRATSLLGAYVPEIGVEVPTAGPVGIYADWGLFPFTAMIARGVAIEWNHRFGPKVDLTDGHVSFRAALNLSLVLP